VRFIAEARFEQFRMTHFAGFNCRLILESSCRR
jgi:hypothetical protein